MRKLGVYNFITLNGYFEGPQGDLSWNMHGQEENEYATQSMKPGNILVFGRITYQHMADFWTSAMAKEQMPAVAEGMNRSEKIVFSRTLSTAGWANTRLIKDNLVEELTQLKQSPGKDMVVLGSGSIVTQLADAGLVDQYEIMLNPVAIGQGTPIFHNISHPLQLELTETRAFKSGVILLRYLPRKK